LTTWQFVKISPVVLIKDPDPRLSFVTTRTTEGEMLR
jgi:hypothetical protein